MRTSCLECVRKHLGEAELAMEEAFCGYPHHAMWAIGSFSQATSEALRAFPELANRIRETRIGFERCLARVLMGEKLVDVAKDLPDMDDLAMTIHEMILVELLTPKQDDAIGVRSVRSALNLNDSNNTQKYEGESVP